MTKVITQDIKGYGLDVFRVMVMPGKAGAIAIAKINGYQSDTAKPVAFKVGDTCVVGSYNLIYTGPILGITEKNVIVTRHGRKAHMKIEDFVFRNWDYNAKRIADENHETSMSI